MSTFIEIIKALPALLAIIKELSRLLKEQKEAKKNEAMDDIRNAEAEEEYRKALSKLNRSL